MTRFIQSETKSSCKYNQANLSIMSLLMDNMICTLTVMIILLTGTWQEAGTSERMMLVAALAKYFEDVDSFLNLLICTAAFTTIMGYLAVGQKCAIFLSEKRGKAIYLSLACFTLLFFGLYDSEYAMCIMKLSSGLLVVINLFGLFKLRKHLVFSMSDHSSSEKQKKI